MANFVQSYRFVVVGPGLVCTLARPPASVPSTPIRPRSTTSAARGIDLGDAGDILDLQGTHSV
jgi:hypothetical protein